MPIAYTYNAIALRYVYISDRAKYAVLISIYLSPFYAYTYISPLYTYICVCIYLFIIFLYISVYIYIFQVHFITKVLKIIHFKGLLFAPL